jgi:hypothetical protein
MAEIIKFNSLNIVAVRVRNQLAQQPKGVQLEVPGGLEPDPGGLEPEPINQDISYAGRLKYTISGDVNYTTSVIVVSMMADGDDMLGFSEVYSALQKYVATVIGAGEKKIRLGSIYFTPTTVTIRVPNQNNMGGQFPNLRSRNTGLVKVPFSQIGDEFEEAMIKFVDTIDTTAREQFSAN